MTRDRLLEQAIELLAIADFHSLTLKEERNQVVREAIELSRQPKPDQNELQEPAGWEVGVVDGVVTRRLAPPQRTWVGLTDEEIDRLWSQSLADTKGETYLPLREFARAIEAAHGIKGDA